MLSHHLGEDEMSLLELRYYVLMVSFRNTKDKVNSFFIPCFFSELKSPLRMDCSCPELGSGGSAGLQPAVLSSLPTEPLPGIKLLNVIYLCCRSFAKMCRHSGQHQKGGQGGCPIPRAALEAATAMKNGRIAPRF